MYTEEHQHAYKTTETKSRFEFAQESVIMNARRAHSDIGAMVCNTQSRSNSESFVMSGAIHTHMAPYIHTWRHTYTYGTIHTHMAPYIHAQDMAPHIHAQIFSHGLLCPQKLTHR